MSATEAARILADVRHAVANWPTFAAAAGCSKKRADVIAAAYGRAAPW